LKIIIPFGKSYLHADVSNLLTTLRPKYVVPLENPVKTLREKLKNPIGTPPLKDLAKEKKDAVIVINDITRPTHSEMLVTEIVRELNEVGIDDKKIKLLVATGNHRANTKIELESMLGIDIVNRIKIYNHNDLDKKSLTYIGTTKRKIPVYINKIFVQSSLKILTGLIAPHHSEGFSGGRKSILPGISGIETIHPHHSFPIRPSEPSMGWIDGNPMHEESLKAARMAKVDFIVNVVNNEDDKIADIYAGDLDKAHKEGIKLCNKVRRVKVPERADIVITSPGGYPRDFDLHQSQKAMSSAEMCCKEGGVIILVTEAIDGIGKFGNWLKNAKTPREVIERFKKEGFTPEASIKAFFYARALVKYKVIVVTKGVSQEELRNMFLIPALDIQEAIKKAINFMGKDAKFIFIPHGSDIIPEINS